MRLPPRTVLAICWWVGAWSAPACDAPPSEDAGPPDAEASSISLAATTAVAGGPHPVETTVTIRDAKRRVVRGATVTATLSGDATSPPQSGNTNGDGITTVSVWSNLAEPKTLTVTASAGGTTVTLREQPVITFVPGEAAGLRFDVQPVTTQAGEAITPAVRLAITDAHGNIAPAPPWTVSIRLTRSNAGGLVRNGEATTSVDGYVTFPMLIIDNLQQGCALRAEATSGAAVESDPFDVVVGPPSHATSTLLAMPVNVVADGVSTSTITASLRDLGNNPVSGVAVHFAASGTGLTLSTADATTDDLGEATTTLRSTTPQTSTVTATAGTLALEADVTFIP